MTTTVSFLDGNFAPVTEEVTAVDLEVTGSLPPDLEGRLVRIGPNPKAPPDPATYHWFTGDGMVHGVRLSDGRAEWYRNRWARRADRRARDDRLVHVRRHAGWRLLGPHPPGPGHRRSARRHVQLGVGPHPPRRRRARRPGAP
jgi:carotenoid cleavage dioxygenase